MPDGRTPAPAPPGRPLPPGPGGLRELPATGLDAAGIAALGSASVAAGAAILARNNRHSEDSAGDQPAD
jgi:hypothetical protein